MRDHGGNLDAAMQEFGGQPHEWLDLSTGINPRPYPLPEIDPVAWNALPTRTDIASLISAAQSAYQTDWACLPTAGAQAGIQMIPRLLPTGHARVLVPTYNEHAASLRAAGWNVEECDLLESLSGADLAVVVNPNNPDGAIYTPDQLLELAKSVGTLIVDESFCDPHPDHSLLTGPSIDNVIVFRSFGKFYGLAGLRLGFTFASRTFIARLSEMSGPWPVSGPAISVGRAALLDTDWQKATITRLAEDAQRLDVAATGRGWKVVGGSTLFRLYETPHAQAAQEHLARHRIWSRIFPYSQSWIRLGLPDGAPRWDQLERALAR